MKTQSPPELDLCPRCQTTLLRSHDGERFCLVHGEQTAPPPPEVKAEIEEFSQSRRTKRRVDAFRRDDSQAHHEETRDDDLRLRSVYDLGRYVCTTCTTPRGFDTVGKYRYHLRKEHPPRCNICEVSFLYPYQLQTHRKREHQLSEVSVRRAVTNARPAKLLEGPATILPGLQVRHEWGEPCDVVFWVALKGVRQSLIRTPALGAKLSEGETYMVTGTFRLTADRTLWVTGGRKSHLVATLNYLPLGGLK